MTDTAEAQTKRKPIRSIATLNPEIKADAGHEFEIMAEDEPTGMFLTVVGKESTIYKQMIRQQINASRTAEYKRQSTGKREAPQTVQEDIEKSTELYAVCVIGWRNVVISDAEGEADFTPENVRRLLTYDFVRIQAEKEILGRGDFTPG